MAYKKIVAVVTGADADAAALAGAFAAARPFDGHVEALFAVPDPREAVPFVGMPVLPEVAQQVIESAEVLSAAACKRAHHNLKVAADEAHATVVQHAAAGKGLTCSFHEVSGRFTVCVADAARLADLVVFETSTTDSGPDVNGAFIDTLTRSGRPVLLAPTKPVADLTRKIIIGWDGGAAAARAMSAALPFLKRAVEVELYSIREVPGDSTSLDAPVTYLALHGVTAGTRIIDPKGTAPGPILLSEAQKAGATMLVLGGYGHSRLLETLFGGTTVHIAANTTLPLFMVH